MTPMSDDAVALQIHEFDLLLRQAVERGATDIHARAGDVLRARISGELVGIGARILSSDELELFARRLLDSSPVPAPPLRELKDFKFPWGAPGIGRFRASILRQRSSFMVVLRVIPFEGPSVGDLGLPNVVTDAMHEPAGLIFVTGHAKSGRSSTIAALVHHLNVHSTSRRHVVMLERATRLLQRDQKCSITQREVGVDVDTIGSGLAAALDQDADVIVLDELPDADILEQVLDAAEGGRLVMVRLDTPDVVSTFRDLLSAPESRYASSLRLRLAKAVQLIISQRLVPRADGRGKALLAEVYRAHQDLQELVRDAGSFLDLNAALESHQADIGTQTFDQHLVDLVARGVVAEDLAAELTEDPVAFRRLLSRQRADRRVSGN